MARTTLGLAGVPRSAPFLDTGASAGRPGTAIFTRIGVAAVARRPQTFTEKSPGVESSRPDGRFTRLGLAAGAAIPQSFSAKHPLQGVTGRTTITVTPSAVLSPGRRVTVVPNVALFVRPTGAVITAAHVNRVAGQVSLTLRAQASTLRYRRYGVAASFQGNNSISVTPFGGLRYRTWERLSGTATVTFEPRATLRYTAAPVRNNRIIGAGRLMVRPQAQLQYTEVGISYSVVGSAGFSIVPNGRVQVTRETTYTVRGSVSWAITPQGTVEHSTGLPMAYGVVGTVQTTYTPAGRMGVQLGIIEQHYIGGSNVTRIQPGARLQRRAAPALDADGSSTFPIRRDRRRLVRVFR